MDWLEGGRLLDYKTRPQEERNQITRALFRAWWYPFSHYGVIHGDPHLGNYIDLRGRTAARRASICSTMAASAAFAPRFVGGVVDLYHGLSRGDRDLIVHAYETWGFTRAVQ